MDAEQIVRISPEVIRELIDAHRVELQPKHQHVARKEQRWPFPGTVELWLPEDTYGERHLLATLHNLSANGLGMRCRQPVPVNTRIAVAIHQPELSCYGDAVIRHCTRSQVGYLIGMEFVFATEEDE